MSRNNSLFSAMALLLSAAPALAAGYDAELDPVPFDASNRAIVIDSIGDASATLDGTTLNVRGNFSKFTSPATGGSVRIGLAKGWVHFQRLMRQEGYAGKESAWENAPPRVSCGRGADGYFLTVAGLH